MGTDIFSQDIAQAIQQAQAAAIRPSTKTVQVDGQLKEVLYPFPSPGDWRDCWVYFLMIDRFNNPITSPNSTRANQPIAWNEKYNFRQGGTFKGVQDQLNYIASLGARAIWLSPVLKNAKPDNWLYNYHGYGTQDFLNVDERFGSDGTRQTAERELAELIDAAHARGLYVILDIVINHAARVFDYVYNGQTVSMFTDAAILDAPPVYAPPVEPPIQWLNGLGLPRTDWQNTLPPVPTLSPDDAIWPSDLQQEEFFRRRGAKVSDTPGPQGFVPGDFGDMRQLVAEYDAQPQGQEGFRDKYGKTPVLSILIRCYQYLIAKYDVDGFRIDTVKYVRPAMIETFGNAIREFALSVGKRNFFTFGEIADSEDMIARFVGRNSTEGFGIDAALDFPLFNALRDTVKGQQGVEQLRYMFRARKDIEQNLISSHGEAGKYFVTFIDNHDQNERFFHPLTPLPQVTTALAVLFALQGIPCLYYGTEQGLQGAIDKQGNPDLDSKESVREALWGKGAKAFDTTHQLYLQIQSLSRLREMQPALRYGRLYFRQLSSNGQDFGYSEGKGGVIAFSRLLTDQEVIVVANTNLNQPFQGFVIVDLDTNRPPRKMTVAHSNIGTVGTGQAQVVDVNFFDGGNLIGRAATATLFVKLAAMEVQILVRA